MKSYSEQDPAWLSQSTLWSESSQMRDSITTPQAPEESHPEKGTRMWSHMYLQNRPRGLLKIVSYFQSSNHSLLTT
jgi:hypothetical protein